MIGYRHHRDLLGSPLTVVLNRRDPDRVSFSGGVESFRFIRQSGYPYRPPSEWGPVVGGTFSGNIPQLPTSKF